MDTKNETKENKNTGRDLERGRDWSEEINVGKKSKSILIDSENRDKSGNALNKKESHIQFEILSADTSQQSDEQIEYELSNTVIDANDYTDFDLENRRESSIEKNVAKSKLEDDGHSQIKKDSNKKKNTENEPKAHSSRDDRKESVDSGKRRTSKHTPTETRGGHYLDPNTDRTQSRTALDLERRDKQSEKKESKKTVRDSDNRHKKSESEGASHSRNKRDSDRESEETSRQNAPAETASTSQQTNERTLDDDKLDAILKVMKFFSR